ncbi:MAG: hypothetical protein ACFFB5_20900 [Promethearchaeota archaeon]
MNLLHKAKEIFGKIWSHTDFYSVYFGLLTTLTLFYLSTFLRISNLFFDLGMLSYNLVFLMTCIIFIKVFLLKDQSSLTFIEKTLEKPFKTLFFTLLPVFVIVGLYLIDASLFINHPFRGIWLYGGGLSIISGILVITPIFFKLEKNSFFFGIIPSRSYVLTRVQLCITLIASFSPIFLVINSNALLDTYLKHSIYNLVEAIFMIGFGLWFFYLIGVLIHSRLFTKIDSEKLEEINKGVLFVALCVIILMSFITFNPKILFTYKPNENIPWGNTFYLFIANNLNFLVLTYPRAINIIKKLSLAPINSPSIVQRVFVILFSVFILPIFFINGVDIADPLFMLIILILEVIYIIMLLWILDDVRSNLKRLNIIEAISYFFLGIAAFGALMNSEDLAYEEILSRSLGIMLFPLLFLFLNVILMNHLFQRFDYSNFLNKEVERLTQPLSNEDAIKIVSIESIDLVPSTNKRILSLKLIEIFRDNILKDLSFNVLNSMRSIELSLPKKEVPFYKSKIELLEKFFEIIEAHYILDLPLKSEITKEFTVEISLIAKNDLFSLNKLSSSFFEAFVRSIRIKYNLTLPLDENGKPKDNLSGNGKSVANFLGIRKREISKISYLRNSYVHELFREIEDEEHLENTRLIFGMVLKMLDNLKNLNNSAIPNLTI